MARFIEERLSGYKEGAGQPVSVPPGYILLPGSRDAAGSWVLPQTPTLPPQLHKKPQSGRCNEKKVTKTLQ